MNTGKTLFAQLMDFLPWTTFTRIVDRYGGDHRVRTLSCAEQYRSMAFAQLTYRAPARQRPASRSTHRNSITWASASRSGARRWPMPTKGATGVSMRRWPSGSSPRRGRCTSTRTGPDQYRLRPGLDDHRSVPVGLSVGALPHHQGGGEDAHAARPAGQHSEFYPHLGWQAADVMPSKIVGSRSHLRRGSWLRRLCPPLCGPSRGLLRQVTSRTSMLIAIRRRDRSTGIIFDQVPGTPVRIPRICGASASRTPSGKTWSSSPTTSRFRPPPSARTLAGFSSSSGSSKSSDQAVCVGERGEDADPRVLSPSSRSASTWKPRHFADPL